ncbi:VCBS repeat-containing protein [Streptomyces sp. SID8367]|nr:VCBS repeat-containing protein [Streptomyces sp. SID8367]
MAAAGALSGCGGEERADGHDYATAVEHPCATLHGTLLHTDVDGDGMADTVSDPNRRSDRTSVTFADGTGITPGARAAPKGSGLEAVSTFGDFDGDGHLDMAIAAGTPDTVDDPAPDAGRVHQVIWGPLGKHLDGKATSQITLASGQFVHGLRSSDGDHDGRAELSVFQNGGDGTVNRYPAVFQGRTVKAVKADGNLYDLAHWPKKFKPGWADVGTCRN